MMFLIYYSAYRIRSIKLNFRKFADTPYVSSTCKKATTQIKIVSEYIDGTYGFREICKRYDINQGSLKDWKRLYETFGWSGLKTGSKTTRYSKETKEAAVRDYLSHEFTFPEILKKYQIRSGTQL